MAKRTEKKLTSKKASKIALLVSAIVLIGMTVWYICLYDKFIIVEGRIVFPVCSIFLALLIYFGVYDMCLKGPNLKIEEEEKDILSDLKKILSQEFQEVYLIFDESDYNTMIKQILQNEGCKFYAKLAENNNIVIIAKDKNDKEVYKSEIENPIYFNHHFKVN